MHLKLSYSPNIIFDVQNCSLNLSQILVFLNFFHLFKYFIWTESCSGQIYFIEIVCKVRVYLRKLVEMIFDMVVIIHQTDYYHDNFCFTRTRNFPINRFSHHLKLKSLLNSLYKALYEKKLL